MLICASCMTLTFGVTYSYSDFFIPLQQQFGWSNISDSTIPAVSLVVFSAGSLLGGILIRHLGWRKVSLTGALLTGLGILLCAAISNYSELLVLFGIVSSLGNAFVVLCSGPITVTWFMKRRGLAVGIAASGSGVGTLVVPPLAENLIAGFGWRIAFLVIGVAFMGLLVSASYFMRTPEEFETKPFGWDALTEEQLGKLPDFTLGAALRTARYWMIFAMFFLGSIGATMFIVHAAPFGVTLGINQFYAAIALGVLGAGSLLARIVMGAVSDKISRATTLTIALLSQLLGLVVVPFANQSVPLFMLCSFAIGFGYGGYLADFISLIGDLFGVKYVASVWGFTEVGYGSGGLIGPIIAGAYFSAYGNYFGIFEVAALACFAGMVVSVFFSREEKLKALTQVV